MRTNWRINPEQDLSPPEPQEHREWDYNADTGEPELVCCNSDEDEEPLEYWED